MVRTCPTLKCFLLGLLAGVAGAGAVTSETGPVALHDLDLTLPADERPWYAKVTRDLLPPLSANPTETVEVLALLRRPPMVAEATRQAPGHPVELAWIDVAARELSAELATTGMAVFERYSHLPVLAIRLQAAAIPALAADPRIESLEPNRTASAMRTEGKALMNVPALHGAGLTGSGVGIAILDTGVDYTHSELSPVGTKTIKLWDAINNDDDPMDDEGHGTGVAGIAAGSANGVAPAATIVAIKVLNASGSGSSSQILNGLNRLIAQVTTGGNPYNVRVANLSLGGYYQAAGEDGVPAQPCDADSPSLYTAFQSLTGAGVLVISAAGNGGCKTGVAWPGCLSNSMAIGAVIDANIGGASFGKGQCTGDEGCSMSSTAAGMIACYSDSGVQLDALAPSHCATTTRRTSGLVGCFGGTSAAAPYAAGVAALLSQGASATPAQVRAAIAGTGSLVQDDRNNVIRPIIDASVARARLTGACSPPTPPVAPTSSPTTLCGTTVQANLTWPSVSGASSYTLETATDASFTSSTTTLLSSPASSVTFTGGADATKYVRVTANSSCGSSLPSPPITLTYRASCTTQSQSYWVSGIAHTPGFSPAFWLSDLAVLNTSSAPAELTLSFFGSTQSATATRQLEGQQQAFWSDVLTSLFALTGNHVGTILVSATQPVTVLARTYSQTTPGAPTFGQSYPGVPVEAMLTSDRVGYLAGLRSDSPFYTNLEFVNPGTSPVDVQVQLYSGAGSAIGGPLTRTVPGERRLAILREAVLPAGVSSAFATVRVLTPGGKVIAFASVVDDLSKDPTTIPLAIP
ncbi:MAG: S8 family serine peptidase [Acidobacteriota bacterium]|mgnify:CR=1 FL=1|jgi:subtilisin family serine protease